MANFDSEFFGLVFSGVSGHPKNSRPKFTSRIVSIPFQFHFLEPKIYSRRFSAYGGDQDIKTFQYRYWASKPKGSATQSGPFLKKVGNPPVRKPPGLPSGSETAFLEVLLQGLEDRNLLSENS